MKTWLVLIIVAQLLAFGGLAWFILRRRERQRINAFLKAQGGRPCPICQQYVSRVALVCRCCAYRFDLSVPDEAPVFSLTQQPSLVMRIVRYFTHAPSRMRSTS